MDEETAVPQPEITPEELAAFYDEQKKLFTVEDLMQYLDDDLPRTPAEDVLTELERDLDIWKADRDRIDSKKGPVEWLRPTARQNLGSESICSDSPVPSFGLSHSTGPLRMSWVLSERSCVGSNSIRVKRENRSTTLPSCT